MKTQYVIALRGYVVASIALLLFSYTQVDLNLTLSRVSVWQGIQKAFQYIGFYERPLATGIYIGIVVSLFALYALLLVNIKKNAVSTAIVWKLIIVVAIILFFSYPAAFSYDFFNYMFTAKTVLVYRQNPYMVIPLQFSGIDPWTNFMRWTHLPSAYTPLWIMMSVVPYLLGLGYFVLVLFAMKGFIMGFYLLACWGLTKAVEQVSGTAHSRNAAYPLAFFALNPLILIESLVSGHNDIVLVALAMVSVFFYLAKDQVNAWFHLGLSIAAKFMTIFLIPVYVFRKDRRWMLGAMLIGLALVLSRREFLPWYWVWVMPFVALNYDRAILTRWASIVSLGLALSYAPFMYFGEYSVIEQIWKTSIIWVGVGIAAVSLLFPVQTGHSSHS